ncbi:MAG: DUF934 domain-containing protein [Myxococcota bacterium]
MTLLRRGEVIEDAFASAVGEESLPADGAVIVDLAQWQAQRDALLSRGAPVGVWLRPDDDPRALADDLSKLAVVALEFPAFTDGRAYSNARILREQLSYQGELRAVGDVLLEQLHFMDRVGFDVFEVRSEDAVQAWKTASADIDVWYQPTGDGRKTALQRRWGR